MRTVTIKELGLEDRVEIITTKWPHLVGHGDGAIPPGFRGGQRRSPGYRPWSPKMAQRLTESSLICEYPNDELGNYRLCPQGGRERWRILSVVSVATSGVMESQVMRLGGAVEKARGVAEQAVSFRRIRQENDGTAVIAATSDSTSFPMTSAPISTWGQIAAGCACVLISDFRFRKDDWRAIAPIWRAGMTCSAGVRRCARPNPRKRRFDSQTICIRPKA